MMVLSFRCSNKGIDYLVISGTQDSPNIDVKSHIKMPMNRNWQEILEWVYDEFTGLVEEHSPDVIVFKRAEPFAKGGGQGALYKRAEIEAILQLIAQKKKLSVKGKVKTTIAKELKFKGQRKYVIRDTMFPIVESNNLTEGQKEAFIAAIGELPKD